MPVTELDKKTALVLIDLQKAIVSRPMVPHSAQDVLTNCAALVSAFRKAGQPIVIVNVIPATRSTPMRADVKMPQMEWQKEWSDIVPEIEVKEGDILITKHTWNAFYNTELDAELKKVGATGIVLGGIATSIGVEGTARAAHELGYNITFAEDAMADMNEKAHENSVTVIFPRIGEVDNTAAIVHQLGA